MDFLLVSATLLLIFIFGLASITKLANLANFRDTLLAFGFVRGLAVPLQVVVPILELMICIALVPPQLRPWAALAALLLLTAFVIVMVVNLAKGRRPKCNCFGQLHSTPIGPATLLRNAIFMALAAFVLVEPKSSQLDLLEPLLAPLTDNPLLSLLSLVLLCVVLAQGWFIAHVLRQNGRLLLRVEDIERHLAAAD